MKFPAPLIRGQLIKRYKRFLCDVELEDGRLVTAHCANPGSMLGLASPGSEVWLSDALGPKAKLKYRWELVRAGGGLVGINTNLANAVAAEAIEDGLIEGLKGYAHIRSEVRYGVNSRIDLKLEDESRPPCYVEVKSVTLSRNLNLAEFPDSVTARGAKHLCEMKKMVSAGARAMMLFVVQRADCSYFSVAGDIDPVYENALGEALAAGVEAVAYAAQVTPRGVTLERPLNVMLLNRAR
jgi:sugar fermentation stimulation protein A